MSEIIPSINVRTFEEVKERIKKVEPYVKWCHLDVTDGIFSKHLTWHNPRDLLNFKTKLNIEVHLMVERPEEIIDQWLVKSVNPALEILRPQIGQKLSHNPRGIIPKGAPAKAREAPVLQESFKGGVKRVIIHLEAAKDADIIIKKCRKAGVEVGLAINPETFWGKFEPWLGKADIYQVLAVHPGPSGQILEDEIYDKIIHIRKSCKECIIEADGGINPETAKKVVESGANLLVAGRAIFSSANIKSAIETLRG